MPQETFYGIPTFVRTCFATSLWLIERQENKMNKQILLIDSNYKTAMILQIVLNDFNVIYSQSKEMALTTLEEGAANIDLIIFDYDMPGIDGLKFVRSLRKEYPEKLLILVSSNIELIKNPALKMGVHGFIQGPIINEIGIKEEICRVLCVSK
jgi:CheY-like chemotaxis protein